MTLLDGVAFTSAMALDGGLPRAELRHLIECGKVRRLIKGVFIDSSVEVDEKVRAMAVLAAAPGDSVASGITAAWLHGIPLLLPNAHLGPLPLELVRPRGTSAIRRSDVSGRTANLEPQDITAVHDVLVTSPARTAVDLARQLDRPFGLSYIDAMLRKGLVTPETLNEVLERSSGLRWIHQGRELVQLGDGRAESAGESYLRLRWIDADLPPLDLQISIKLDGREVARIDSGLPESRQGLEYDGEEFHGPDHVERDRARRLWLRTEFGWHVEAVRRDAVLGRGHGFERLVAEQFGLSPTIVPWELRRRTDYVRLRARSRRRAGTAHNGDHGSAPERVQQAV